MSIEDHFTEFQRERFAFLVEAAKHGNLALFSAERRDTGEKEALLVVVRKHEEKFDIIPIGKILQEDELLAYKQPEGSTMATTEEVQGTDLERVDGKADDFELDDDASDRDDFMRNYNEGEY
jgi:hypothetical protein